MGCRLRALVAVPRGRTLFRRVRELLGRWVPLVSIGLVYRFVFQKVMVMPGA